MIPNILINIRGYLTKNTIKLSKIINDGRVCSLVDEDLIINGLEKEFGNSIVKSKERMWYDIKVNDHKHGWIPVNIKSTSMKSNDNAGNMTMCVYSFTDYEININKNYKNGKMSKILLEKIKKKELNNSQRDYYFLVLNKNKPDDVIINSIRGLEHIVANPNNLPFQINWNKNRTHVHKPVEYQTEMFLNCLKKCEPSWSYNFLNGVKAV